MAKLICFLVAIAFIGNASDRTIIHFSSQNCPACRKIQPVIDQLNGEGWAIRSIDTEKDISSVDQWRVNQIPTLIVLENGREVDRIVGSLDNVELKRRLTGNKSPYRTNELPRTAGSNLTNRAPNLFFGPNHPLNNPNFGPNHPLNNVNPSAERHRANAASSREDVLVPTIGVNHPYYSVYNKSRIASRDPGNRKIQPSRAPSRSRTEIQLPEFPESLAATVRIRIKYEQDESVATGTIIDSDGDESLVLTCGHLFRQSDSKYQMTVELFQNGKIVQVPATLFDYRNDEVDLGLVRFRQTNTVSKVRLMPKGELLREQDPVFSIGCDGGDHPSRRDTVITKLNRFLGPSNIEIAGAPVQGRSGGGLFDARGRLLGVCIAADNDLDEGLFVGPDAIYSQLEKHQLNRLFE